MRTLLLVTALTVAAAPAWAKVIMNSFDENGTANAKAEIRAEAVAKGQPVPAQAKEYVAPTNAWSSTWAAAQAKMNQVVAGTEQGMQENKVANAQKDLKRATKSGNASAIAAAKAKLAKEEAELKRISLETKNYSVSASEHWGKSKEFTYNAMADKEGKQPIAGFKETEYKDAE